MTRPGQGEVLVEVKAAGVCGSDLHIQEGRTRLATYPLTLGHENAGVVAQLGPGVDGWREGDRVCTNFLLTCGKCAYCAGGRPSLCLHRSGLGMHRDGGFARYVTVPARGLIALPDNVSFEQGAVATDAIATPYHAITKRMRPRLGESVVVYGIGGLGFHAVQLLRLHGAHPIIAVDVVEENLTRATTVGADHVVNASEADPVQLVRGLTDGLGADHALELVGREETIAQATMSVRPGGRAVLVGHGAPCINLMAPGVFVRQELEVIGSYAFEATEIAEVLRLISCGRLDLNGSITHRLELQDVNQALEMLKSRRENPIRIVIHEPGGTP